MSEVKFETRPDHAQWGFLWFKEQEIFKATEADIAKIAEDFHRAGITHVMTFSSTHFRWNFRSYWPQINETIGKIVRACHARGMYVVEHHSCNLFCGYRNEAERANAFRRATTKDYPKLEEEMQLDSTVDGVKLRDLLQHSGITGDTLRVELYYAFAMCTNNPLYRERYFKYLESVYAQGVDGIMTDDVEFYDLDACDCPHCRKLFTEQFGLELPPSGDAGAWKKMLADTNGKLFLAWKNFRYNSSREFHQAVVDHYTSLGLKMLRPNYIATALSWANPWAYVFDDLPRLDWGFQECCCGAIRYSWPEYVLEAHHRSAVCRRYNVPAMSLYYPSTPNLQKFAWALSLYCGHKYLGTAHSNDLMGEGPLRAFESEHFDLLNGLEPNSAVGIYDSARSRELDGNYSDETYKAVCGAGQACIFANIPLRIVGYQDWKEFNRFKVIVVPSVRFMADSEIARLGNFMRNGGTLIWADNCGLGDCVECSMRNPEKLKVLLGDEGAGKLMMVPPEVLAVPSYKRAFTYGTEIDKDGVHLPSDGPWQPFTPEQNARRAKLAEVILEAIGGSEIELTGAPADTLASSFYNRTGTLTVQMVNAHDTLIEDAPGAGFAHADPVPFAPNPEPIMVKLRKPEELTGFKYSTAKLYTLRGEVKVPVHEKQNSLFFTVPAGELSDYLLIELDK